MEVWLSRPFSKNHSNIRLRRFSWKAEIFCVSRLFFIITRNRRNLQKLLPLGSKGHASHTPSELITNSNIVDMLITNVSLNYNLPARKKIAIFSYRANVVRVVNVDFQPNTANEDLRNHTLSRGFTIPRAGDSKLCTTPGELSRKLNNTVERT